MNLAELLTANDIVLGLRAPDVPTAAARLLETTLPRRGFVPAEVRRLVDAVVAREREVSTVCGACAIPHARDAALRTFVAALGVNPDGVVDGNAEQRLVIAFLSPEPKRAEHLALLASLARLSRNTAAIDAIAAGKDPNEVVEMVRDYCSDSRSASSS